MATTTSTRRPDTAIDSPSRHLDRFLRVLGASLCLGVTYVHLDDQDFFSFSKTPTYMQALYVVLEIAAVLTAIALLVRARRIVWLAAVGLGIGPIVGYLLSRGPGLPHYTDDRGNWSEPLGLISLAVEVALLAVALIALAVARRRSR